MAKHQFQRIQEARSSVVATQELEINDESTALPKGLAGAIEL